jgi:hypothetical protein
MRKTDTKPYKFKVAVVFIVCEGINNDGNINISGLLQGSVFVEYASLDDAKKVAEQKLQYKDTDLLIMTK